MQRAPLVRYEQHISDDRRFLALAFQYAASGNHLCTLVFPARKAVTAARVLQKLKQCLVRWGKITAQENVKWASCAAPNSYMWNPWDTEDGPAKKRRIGKAPCSSEESGSDGYKSD